MVSKIVVLLLNVFYLITIYSKDQEVPPTFTTEFNLRDRISLTKIKEWEKNYETLSEIPTIKNGYMVNSTVYIIKSQRNERQKKHRAFVESYIFNEQTQDKYERAPWVWNNIATSVYPSPSGNKLAVINNIIIDSTSQTVIEIYDKHQLIDTIYPPDQTFSTIYKSGIFSSISWSYDENFITFIAETNFIIASKNLFNDKTTINEEYISNNNDTQRYGQKYEFREDYGNGMNGAHLTSLFIFDLNKRQLYRFDDSIISNRYSLGECIFDPNDSSSILVVAYDNFPRRWIHTRPSQIWLIKVPLLTEINDNFVIKNAKITVLPTPKNDHNPKHIRFGLNG
eukprot:56062_1